MAPSILLVDYSKHRADITNASFSDSFSGHDSLGSFFALDGGEKLDNNSIRTQSTVSSDPSTSSTSTGRSSVTTNDQRPVSFRVRRSSVGGSAGTPNSSPSNSAPHPTGSISSGGIPSTAQKLGISSITDRLHNSLQDIKYNNSKERDNNDNSGRKMKRRYSTNSTDTFATADTSVNRRLQYEGWKRKQESLLSMSAQIATSNTSDYLATTGRRQRRSGSMPFITGNAASAANESLAKHHSFHVRSSITSSDYPHHQSPQQQQFTRSKPTRHSSGRRATLSHTYSPRRGSTTHSPKRASASPRPTSISYSTHTNRRTTLTRSASSRRNLVRNEAPLMPGGLDSSSQHRVRGAERRMTTRSERITSTRTGSMSMIANGNFVTGSRIRRIDYDASTSSLNRSSVHNRSSILPTHQMLGYE